MSKIRIAIAGVGNCASSLIQGLAWYAAARKEGRDETTGLMHPDLGGYRAEDVEVVAAFDVDSRKVGRPLEEAIFAAPNNTKDIYRHLPRSGVVVQMGKILDGVAPHMASYRSHERFEPSDATPVNPVRVLVESKADILVNYMPVGSQQATEHYARACLDAGVSLVNCVPVFIVSSPQWAREFTRKGIPCVGDDVKAQVGATITHRTLMRLLADRGMAVDNTYQLNVGGNTDFLNMLNRDRLASKKVSKTEAVQSQLDEPLDDQNIHIGPSDYIPFLKDNKVCFLRIAARGFGGIPMEMELRLSVEDSPNSAGVVVDAIRCCKLARERGLAGPLLPVSAYTMKHPPVQMYDTEARERLEEFIATCRDLVPQMHADEHR
jgi:myo-inositol-1-phosphate synthase